MMLPVPGIERQPLIQRDLALLLGVEIRPLPLPRADLLQDQNPTPVEGVQKIERQPHRRGPRVAQLGPPRLLVRPDGGARLGERELEAGVGVEMAVRNVVDDLANGPPTGAVGGVELLRGKPRDGGTQQGRRGGDPVNALATLAFARWAAVLEFPDREAGVFGRH